MLEKVIEIWTSRLDYIQASRGSHMPEIIFKMGDWVEGFPPESCIGRGLVNATVGIVGMGRVEFQTTGTTVRKVGGDHPKTTTVGDDRYIFLQAKRDRQQSASVIAEQLSTATGRQVLRFTVARRLHKGAYSPAVLNATSR
ncbi:transposable element Tcb2 transposase [Trichonephila clavipes]|nr:transposable element Tcb2 transposase [Trichonephila clavipes]